MTLHLRTAALTHCRSGLSPDVAVELACQGRSLSPAAREALVGLCAADLRRRQAVRS